MQFEAKLDPNVSIGCVCPSRVARLIVMIAQQIFAALNSKCLSSHNNRYAANEKKMQPSVQQQQQQKTKFINSNDKTRDHKLLCLNIFSLFFCAPVCRFCMECASVCQIFSLSYFHTSKHSSSAHFQIKKKMNRIRVRYVISTNKKKQVIQFPSLYKCTSTQTSTLTKYIRNIRIHNIETNWVSFGIQYMDIVQLIFT